jgi:anaerobic selenocysteine-containing dehydrogenase
MTQETKYRICPLCEATCGLELTVDDGKVLQVRGDAKDAFSEGYVCPKGVALKDLHEDPDRLRVPMMRDGDTWRETSWDEAFAVIKERLLNVIDEHGRSSVAVFSGNPGVHNISLGLYASSFLRALSTPNFYSASTVDQRPKELASALMFGAGGSIPVVDIDRCNYLIILGANPLDSNGSLMTAPNFGERLKLLKKRGKLVVIDPRKTKTAKLADEYLPIRPGTDALFLFSIINVLFEEGLTNPGSLEAITSGINDVRKASASFTPELVSEHCGISADAIRSMARTLAEIDGAAVYARMGTSTQEFGTICGWLPEVIHVLTGNFDKPGGAMFPLAAHGGANSKGAPGKGKGLRMGRTFSRVRKRPEIFGEFPVAGLAEEIETPGEGQIRALFTIAGNPILSTPNSDRLNEAFESLDFMVSLDIYLNETSRHADVILPGLSPLEVPHYDFAFSGISIQNHARFSKAIFPKPEGSQEEWKTLLRLAHIAADRDRNGTTPDIADLDDQFVLQMIGREVGFETSPVYGRDPQELLVALGDRRGPERVLDFQLRTGPYGEGFGSNPDGLTLEKVENAPHGIPIGPMQPRLPDALRTVSGTIDLAPEMLLEDLLRLESSLEDGPPTMVLIGRREIRSNNSWMHNLKPLVSGKNRCTAMIHPDDATAYGLESGDGAEITSRVATLTAAVEITDDIMPGVLSLPHGWGHDLAGTRMTVAGEHHGVNSNRLTDEEALDIPSGTSVLNGIPISVRKAQTDAEVTENEQVSVVK